MEESWDSTHITCKKSTELFNTPNRGKLKIAHSPQVGSWVSCPLTEMGISLENSDTTSEKHYP